MNSFFIQIAVKLNTLTMTLLTFQDKVWYSYLSISLSYLSIICTSVIIIHRTFPHNIYFTILNSRGFI